MLWHILTAQTIHIRERVMCLLKHLLDNALYGCETNTKPKLVVHMRTNRYCYCHVSQVKSTRKLNMNYLRRRTSILMFSP